MWLPATCNAGVPLKHETSGGTFEDSPGINTQGSLRQNSHELWDPYWVILVKRNRLSQVTRDKLLITQRRVKGGLLEKHIRAKTRVH